MGCCSTGITAWYGMTPSSLPARPSLDSLDNEAPGCCDDHATYRSSMVRSVLTGARGSAKRLSSEYTWPQPRPHPDRQQSSRGTRARVHECRAKDGVVVRRSSKKHKGSGAVAMFWKASARVLNADLVGAEAHEDVAQRHAVPRLGDLHRSDGVREDHRLARDGGRARRVRRERRPPCPIQRALRLRIC